MLKVYTCFVTAHDLRLVALAVTVCALASYSAINLLGHARDEVRWMQRLWLAVAAVSTGFGIWATHFIAMLAFSPGIASAYNITLTVVSLVAAILLTGAGFTVALWSAWAGRAWLGGAIVGAGIAAMHYIGMAAFEVAGIIIWDPVLVAVSILLSGAIGAFALPVGLRQGRRWQWRAGGTALLTLAICSHHFTAMAAIGIIPDSTYTLSRLSLPAGPMSVGVALVSFAIVLVAFGAVAIDLRDKRRAALENERMRALANAAVEGLAICEGTLVTTVNTSLASLVGTPVDAMAGTPIQRWLPDPAVLDVLGGDSERPVETELRLASGDVRIVEMIVRPIIFEGREQRAVALRDLTDRKAADRHIAYLAHHDVLTGIPNRAFFNDRLDEEIAAAARLQQRLAVLCLDLDGFKEVNDLYGHSAGDRVLESVARRIKGALSGKQIVARLGGDEFAILMPQLTSPAAAGDLADRIAELLKGSAFGGDTEIVSTSIGIAIYPDDAQDRQTLLSHADTALYRAKNEGRNTWRFFEASMGIEMRDRRSLEHDLRHAVSRDQLRIVYQPQNNIASNRTVGFEALLRWEHPTRGFVSPALFVPLAEESGSIGTIGEWVLKEACREAASWPQPLTIAINVSPVQIYSDDFARLVHMTLLETGLAASRLELEITETALVRDFNRALTALRQIKALGVRVAMDDFGTGYSSLSNLRAFPFDKIKIDASFIRSVDENSQAATIVRAVLGLGKGLGLPVLAEGVERPEELTFLANANCTEVQGYLTGQPRPIEDFRHVTHEGRRAVPLPRSLKPVRVA